MNGAKRILGVLGLVSMFLMLDCLPAAAGAMSSFGFLEAIDVQPFPWIPERTDSTDEGTPAVQVAMAPFYEDFERDGIVSFYVGYGYQSHYPERADQLLEMLKLLASHFALSLSDWKLEEAGTLISFRDPGRQVAYRIRVEGERNAYLEAFSSYDVILYHGHSRYGQGPAFGGFQNYFRMGRNFSSIEVDTRNRYFPNEPIMDTDRYPPREAVLGGRRYQYQYRGNVNKKSKLPWDSYTRRIPGNDIDLLNTTFRQERQVFYFYSCKNRGYWRESIRQLFPDPNAKMVFGTFRNGHGATRPTAVMIMSMIRHAPDSLEVVRELNATRDCDDCFTSY